MDTLHLPPIDDAVARAGARLSREQQPDGHFVFELEADATIPAEFVLLTHFLDRSDRELEQAIGVYLRRIQADHGGWPLFHGGKFDISASVKAYFALKMIGDDPQASHMARARAAILGAGGAERANVFTRAQLALYGEVPWRAVPVMPVEIMLLPRWFPFHLDKVSYWSRTVIVPLLVLMALRPKARNQRGVTVQELFATPPAQVRDWIRGPFRSGWGHVFKHVDRVLRVVVPILPQATRQRAVARAVAFVTERLNGEDGLGGIYPAMANAMMMFDTLGHGPDHPDAAICWRALRKLLVIRDGEAYCQPCLSPVWDTALAGHAIAEAAGSGAPELAAANAWLRGKQVLDVAGDWEAARPGVAPGGWAFQYENPHYPDVDDTAVVGMLLHRQGDPAHGEAIRRARDWIIGMQSRDGGWGAFDADNTHHYLNHIPFADHGALLDPPTADVTARCVSFLAQIGEPLDSVPIRRAVAWLRREQEADGAWFGRWGTNYIYGTWSVLCALNAAGVAHDEPCMRRAVDFLLSVQRADGGWGEDNASYAAAPRGAHSVSTPSQTAWAVLGLMAAGQARHQAVARGIAHLATTQAADGGWEEAPYTAVGFPRVFYLRYHGYRLFFPLLALARFRNLTGANDKRVAWGVLIARLGIVVGLAAEARIARRLGLVAIGGGLPAGAAAAAERLVGQGATGLLSFGLAGGLDPALAAGDLVVPEAVIEDGHVFAVDRALAARFGALMPIRALAAQAVLAGVAEKQAAFAASGAAIVDLESGAVARVAARHGLPFAVLRAVCDPAGRGLPPLALAALDGGGRIGAGRVMASLLRHPGQIPALLGLARDAARARAALIAAVRRSLA